jgi:hypothetical protein
MVNWLELTCKIKGLQRSHAVSPVERRTWNRTSSTVPEGHGDGKPDWWLTYFLGPNAGAEYRTAPDDRNPAEGELRSETDSPVPEMEVNGMKIE